MRKRLTAEADFASFLTFLFWSIIVVIHINVIAHQLQNTDMDWREPGLRHCRKCFLGSFDCEMCPTLCSQKIEAESSFEDYQGPTKHIGHDGNPLIRQCPSPTLFMLPVGSHWGQLNPVCELIEPPIALLCIFLDIWRWKHTQQVWSGIFCLKLQISVEAAFFSF